MALIMRQNLSVFPSLFLPPLSYFNSFIKAENAVIDIYENYIKQTCRNRCFIYAANGILPLVIPVHKNEQHTPLKEIKIAYENKWQNTLWRSIVSAYGSSPFFTYYDYIIEPVFKQESEYLVEYNTQLMELLLKLLKVPQKVHLSSHYIEDNILIDYRNNYGKHYRSNSNLTKKYHQPFEEKYGFQHDLSILDLLFNEGPNAINYLK
jgi:hypothetical protein